MLTHVIPLYPVGPRTLEQFPNECETCIDAASVSVSMRDVFDPERIGFRVNHPEGILPVPVLVFND